MTWQVPFFRITAQVAPNALRNKTKEKQKWAEDNFVGKFSVQVMHCEMKVYTKTGLESKRISTVAIMVIEEEEDAILWKLRWPCRLGPVLKCSHYPEDRINWRISTAK